MLCLLHSFPMDNSTLEQTDISTDTSIDTNVKNRSVSDIYYHVFINSRDISTKGISSADVIIKDRQWSFKEDFLFGNCS